MGSRCETKEVCQGFTFFWFFLNFYCSGQTLVNYGQRRLARISTARYWVFTLNQQLIWCDNMVYFVGINGFQSFPMYFWYLLCKKTSYSLQIARSHFSSTTLTPNVKIHCHAKMHPCAKFEAIGAMFALDMVMVHHIYLTCNEPSTLILIFVKRCVNHLL